MSDVNFNPLAVTYKRAAELTGKSVRTIQYAVSAGCLETRGEGKGKVIPFPSLEAWVDAGLPTTLGRR